jgi:hypothetical protein
MFESTNANVVYEQFFQPEPIMRNRKVRASSSGFNVIQVSELDLEGKPKRTTYEVTEPDGSVAGLFGSLKEADDFFMMLCRLSSQNFAT